MSDTPRTDAILPLGSGRNPEIQHVALELAGLSRALERELAEAKRDAERVDWLERMHVEARIPLRHGSRALFHACPDLEETKSDLRAQIDSASRPTHTDLMVAPETIGYLPDTTDSLRLDWIINWMSFHDTDLPCRDWSDNQDARAAIDAAMRAKEG